jgi:hypothetical protein
MEDAILGRVARAAGVPDLVEVLADRLSPTDLQSLLLAVYQRQAARITPARLLAGYTANRFTAPSVIDPVRLARLDLTAFELAQRAGFQPVELSPVSPLGTVSAVALGDQNRIITTARNSEVVADSTNVLALESALRRKELLRQDPRSQEWVRLAASHRLTRAQLFDGPRMTPHFRLFAMTTAGRDEGSFRFEVRALLEQLDLHLCLLERSGLAFGGIRVAVTDLSAGQRRTALADEVLAPLAARHPAASIGFDDARQAGRGYYRDACFFIYATTPAGDEFGLADGGFTDWTARLTHSGKERLLTSGLGTERLTALFEA